MNADKWMSVLFFGAALIIIAFAVYATTIGKSNHEEQMAAQGYVQVQVTTTTSYANTVWQKVAP